MRPSTLSILSAASVLTSAAAATTPPERYALHSSLLNSKPLPWGVIPSGGDSSSQDSSDDYGNSSSADSSSAPPQNKGKPTKSQSQSSKILDSVHAGGAFQYPPVSSSSSSSSKRTLINDRQNDFATNPQNMVEAAEEILNSRKHHQEIESDEGNGQIMTNNNRSNNEKGPQKGPLRILFLSSDTGGGHRASAEALANQFQRLYPGTTYDLLDIWSDIDSSWPYNTIKECYKSFSASPWKWRTLYHVSNTAIYAKFADLHSYYMNEEMIREKIEEYNPDVVVSVHPTMNYIPLFSTRKISDKTGKEIPFFTVVTDFGSGHCTWFNKDVDRMYLASEPIKAIAQKRGGVPDEKIVMSGLPIRYDFAAQADAMGDRTTEEGKAHQRSIREELNINPNKRMVLVMGGGEGVGSLSDIVNELYAKLRTQGVDATICVVCGRNEQLKEDLQTRCWDT
ncbi:hypothetical protein ACHAWC_006956, partial [Mediolabrus comicus]